MDGWKALLGNEFSDNGLIIISSSYQDETATCTAMSARSISLSEYTAAVAITTGPLPYQKEAIREEEEEKKEKMIMFKQGKMMNRKTNRKKSISSSSIRVWKGEISLLLGGVDLFARRAPLPGLADGAAMTRRLLISYLISRATLYVFSIQHKQITQVSFPLAFFLFLAARV